MYEPRPSAEQMAGKNCKVGHRLQIVIPAESGWLLCVDCCCLYDTFFTKWYVGNGEQLAQRPACVE